MFINDVYTCIFITKLCFFLLLNKVTCLSRLRTLFTRPLVLFPAWEEGGRRACEDTTILPQYIVFFKLVWSPAVTLLSGYLTQEGTCRPPPPHDPMDRDSAHTPDLYVPQHKYDLFRPHEQVARRECHAPQDMPAASFCFQQLTT